VVPAAVAACVAAITGAVVVAARWPSRSLVDAAGSRAVLLSLIPWVLVSLCWAPMAALKGLRDSNVSIRQGWDPWMGSRAVAIAGSWWWLLAAAIGYIWLLRHASSRLDRLFSPDATHCPACGYDLRGSPDGGVCPECGWVRGSVSLGDAPTASSTPPRTRSGSR
jgi:hypothetical protein